MGFYSNYYGNTDAENVPTGTQLWIITNNRKHFAFASHVKYPFGSDGNMKVWGFAYLVGSQSTT